MNTIFERRSVRDFLPKPVEREKLERVLRAAFQTPSAHNRQPWEFLVLTGQEDKEAIASMSPYAKMCVSAAAVRACCANLIRGEPESFPSEASGGAASGKPGEDSFWVQDLAAATENALLQIVEEGLGGVWLGWYPDSGRVKVFSDRFKLPGHIIPVSLIALGYPARETHPKDRFDPLRVHYESWEA